ncbi:hypothetical protein G7B40_030295 [Aetokthonos hydrillicola Thurmond2011]|jgi:hypothetical protein|uniref:Uncharacterized protein n=1 Tax=Aetokthonos hydrillicola Thurmond2011 TaxID=2712845 RepID=A0AAP5ICC0_9CYAN|nr:hypothetical protein [Aetokthonos hydrillicola]MBO3459871.1 hypothetical protein [Aetokthonos hydrillicola CCALA 1050]MBW4583987.1 hypothetical protein [Aetokthonos hydrillicola CCALA 1050]MDR9898816.1 hypothetical protein [Aetokthonos hydrillicola Thurmond2011]
MFNRVVTLKCLGDVEGPRFLDGRTREGSVGLAPGTDGVFTGTRWEMTDLDDDKFPSGRPPVPPRN